ncbi:MAG: succinate dehydrogenase assembly factor 2 [Burkholderiaceae bacterium]
MSDDKLAAERRRLRWRARRGLLENDIVLTRFLDREQDALTDADVIEFDRLLDLTDNELLDLLLERRPLPEELASTTMRSLLERLRSA